MNNCNAFLQFSKDLMGSDKAGRVSLYTYIRFNGDGLNALTTPEYTPVVWTIQFGCGDAVGD